MPKGTANLTHIGNLIDVTKVKASRHVRLVHSLRFEKATNKIESGFPSLYVTKPVMVKKGALVQLY